MKSLRDFVAFLLILRISWYYLLQERNAILDGQTELTITTHIGGSPTTLVLTSSGHSVLYTSGN